MATLVTRLVKGSALTHVELDANFNNLNSELALKSGYGAGSGGAVIQVTNKATAVTLNKASGQITLNNAALASNTTVSFTFNNSLIAATDNLVLTLSGGGTNGAYQAWVGSVSAGSCAVNLRNISGGSLSEAVVINYALVKSANA